MEKDFYTVKEFADAYECSPDRVYEWLRTGKIEYYARLTPHAIYRIPKTELARLKGEGKTASEESVVQQPVHKEVDPSIVIQRREHFAELTDITNLLLSNDVDRVMKGGTVNIISTSGEKGTRYVEYYFTDGTNFESPPYDLTKEQLSDQLKRNIEFPIHKYTEWVFYKCFLPHLISELPEELKTEGFYTIVQEQPYQLIETLRLLAARKTFKGTCPVCEDW